MHDSVIFSIHTKLNANGYNRISQRIYHPREEISQALPVTSQSL